MADRFTYLPSIGLFIMLGWSVPSRALEGWISKVITCVVAAAVLAVCAALSRVQLGYWKDSEALFRHDLDVTRDNWLAQNNLGTALLQAGQIEEAIRHYEQALRIDPDYAEAHNNLGVALTDQGKVTEAIAHYQQMIAWLAFMLGEKDEMALQRSLVATDEAIRAPVPSVVLNLG